MYIIIDVILWQESYELVTETVVLLCFLCNLQELFVEN